jgi:acetamidase/formamidase
MGGNLDNKELIPGAKLYLPAFVPGALFFLRRRSWRPGRRRGLRHRDRDRVAGTLPADTTQGFAARLAYPRAETPTHYMTMAMDPDLDQCVVRALRDMIALLSEKRNLSREDAYTLCSLAADLRVTQTVNGSKVSIA